MNTLKITNTEHHHDHHHEHDDSDEVIPELQPAVIFDAGNLGEAVPAGFDAVRIPLDGKIKADLSWKKQHAAAKLYVEQGLRIFWEIDLGLFTHLNQPLSSHTQFLALALSLEHFRDTLWKEFRAHTVGLCLYRGTLDFSSNFPWDEEQTSNLQHYLKEIFSDIATFNAVTHIKAATFENTTPETLKATPAGQNLLRLFCRDSGGEYLELLAARLPDTLPLFALFDGTSIKDPYELAQLLTKERYPSLHLGIRGTKQQLGGELGWEEAPLLLGYIGRHLNAMPIPKRPRLGLCLPKLSYTHQYDDTQLRRITADLCKSNGTFRIIPENYLSLEWDDLDHLIVDSQYVDKMLLRKLQGFCAAGGTVLYVSNPIGLPSETPIEPLA